ncbi:preprotein translocase subunit SecD [Mycolicibacterium mageritense DSM 44476 = CIP 104973]|uniref:SecDF P1 head subdomain domain-containing protein n=1 Tax=Mycolicibacterium mageritense TaxID=53462 RepID=A0ABM7I1A9_MYCME|nr:hypothetical protein [Mycolicibacterium mageritense]MCC9184633.1 hypothetical protein [Mycolicibacterium mageritense]BBX36678.1 hypothetical protein MMAGJ_59600 [Mycolicibacterium mageritense]CDO26311.1 preprotein translocase subunit SecD [Mycolicibacterium mageritense DSM 44476 = CIP 104973]
MPDQRSTAVKIVVVCLLALMLVGYLLAVFLTKDIWGERQGTRLTFTAQTPDGSAPSPDAVAETLPVLEGRLAGLGLTHTKAVAENGTIVATVANRNVDAEAVREILKPGQLYIRPVIHAMPSKAGTPPPPTQPKATEPQRIADEKQLRQTTDQTVQILALQFQATRCGEDDVLAGHDDPNLPLVTCSADGQTVYLLNKSILSGADIAGATSGLDKQMGQYVVDMEFDDAGARTWIRESIPGGRTQITGQFTADSAHELASVLSSGALPLPLSLDSSDPQTISAPTSFIVARVVVIVAGAVLAMLVVAAAVYLLRRKPDASESAIQPPGF